MSGDTKRRKIILGVDIGTTNAKCFAYDQHSNVIGEAREGITVLNLGNGRYEIEPDLLWLVFKSVISQCLINSRLNAADISCLGISTQRGTFLTWNRVTQESFHNFITWKDRRSEELCEQWNSSIFFKLLRFGAYILYIFTCQKLLQIFSKFKFTSSMVLSRLYWIMTHDKKVRNKIFQDEALFGTIDTWLVWKLTGGKVHATDPSNACISGFFDPFKMDWSNIILWACSIPRNILPDIKNTCDSYGETLPDLFGAAIPIYAVVGDQQASLFGAGCFNTNSINCTMGTGTFFNMNTGSEPAPATDGIYPLVGWTISSNTTYIIECGMHDVATILTVAQNLDLFKHPDESCRIAQSVSDSDGVYFLPSACLLESAGKRNVNLSSLYGLKANSSKQHIVRAILESLAFQVRLLFDAVGESYDINANIIRVCGGISKNDFVLQLISDISQKAVKRLKHNESSSLGAALFAGLYCGVFKSIDEITAILNDCDMFYPSSVSGEKYESRYLNWKKAVSNPHIIDNFF